MVPLSQELKRATELALAAGAILLEHERAGVEVEFKGPDDPVTRADREASVLIVDGLTEAFPHDAVMSEEAEDDRARLACERVWIVDPMDGTREFLRKNGEYAVMIGLAIGGVPQLGVVFQPSRDALWSGVVGGGATARTGGRAGPAQVDPRGAGDEPLRLAVSRSHRSKRIDRLKLHIPISDEVVSGSVGLKVGLVVERRCDAYVVFDDKTKEWDTCGPQAILIAAGGRVTDLQGRPVVYNREDVRNRDGLVFSNGTCHDRLLAAIPPVIAWHEATERTRP
jgi:3'(2'), 5'-bisphosphate nucleotidase